MSPTSTAGPEPAAPGAAVLAPPRALLALPDFPGTSDEREALGQDGFVMVSLRVNRSGQLIARPEIISRGFIYMPEAEELFETVRTRISAVAARPTANLAEKVEQALSDFFYNELKRHPMVFVLVNPVDYVD